MVRRVLFAVVLVVLAAPAVASACTIAAMNPYERVKGADHAVYGRVLAIHWLGPGHLGSGDKRYAIRVRVLRVFKGHPGKAIRLVGHTNGASCGVSAPKVGRRLGLLLYGASPFPIGLGTEISLFELREAQRGPPPPARPPWAEPRAGPAAYLATVDVHAATNVTYLIALDRRGRVVRSLGRYSDDDIAVCPGGRRFVTTGSYAGEIVTHTPSRIVSRRTIPLYDVYGLGCLDEQARTVALVTRYTNATESEDSTATLRTYTGTTKRSVLKFDAEVLRIDASGLYVSDQTGIRQYDVLTGALETQLTGIEFANGAFEVLPSPDNRLWAIGAWAGRAPSEDRRFFLADPATTHIVPIEVQGLFGWLGSDGSPSWQTEDWEFSTPRSP